MAAGMNQPPYTREILRLAASIPQLGERSDPVGRAPVRSPTCGSTVAVSVKLDEVGRIAEFGQQVQACAFGQASAALVGAFAVGRDAREVERGLTDFSAWLDGSRDDPGRWPGLAALEPARSRRARHGAMLLPFRALLAAIADAQTR